MKIRKAIIPAAGLGTRVLPASKAMPKEMLPIVDKPAIQYIVEEAVKAGITDILIITNRGKGIIEDHFDHSVELEAMLEKRGNTEMLETLQNVAHLANIYYIRQKQTRGLGDAVLRAKEFVGDEPFAVLYGDDVIVGDIPAIGELCEAYEKYGLTRDLLVAAALKEYRSYYDVYGSVLGRTDTRMSRHLKGYISTYEYRCIAYDKGVVMFDTLRKSVGDDKFFEGLRNYYKTCAYKVAQSGDLVAAFEKVGLDVQGFFDSFLEGKAIL